MEKIIDKKSFPKVYLGHVFKKEERPGTIGGTSEVRRSKKRPTFASQAF
jgi:hypothetical protein